MSAQQQYRKLALTGVPGAGAPTHNFDYGKNHSASFLLFPDPVENSRSGTDDVGKDEH